MLKVVKERLKELKKLTLLPNVWSKSMLILTYYRCLEMPGDFCLGEITPYPRLSQGPTSGADKPSQGCCLYHWKWGSGTQLSPAFDLDSLSCFMVALTTVSHVNTTHETY